ncbi:S9 family peptidase [Pedobacter changchengzhani]|uniref:S9 family peptidase n=1 Tax=Pedobacter changchengzhani TaxID=2529274 RepID=A0A4R5MJK3_9SPHI|nr:DPP IV N-terminal domain-containing protein [Pedobacter changchengzhani]TDG35780.1 S9 family peptidase [Pedobacter changchengzhani]
MKKNALYIIFFSIFFIVSSSVNAQNINWAKDGNSYYESLHGQIVLITLPKNERKVIFPVALFTPNGSFQPLNIEKFQLSNDLTKALIYTNSKKVWRDRTRGDYWLADLTTNTLVQIGKNKPSASLMFAKISPDGSKVAYVSKHNLYVENIDGTGERALTIDGTDRIINGTFDWAYEEEFHAQDGFRWSPDGKSIAYWQLDARKIKNFLMINNTDSIYSFTIPIEYPKVGQDPSACKIGIVDVASAKTNWLDVPGDNIQHYIPRMQWVPNTNEVILQQLNREQNESKIFICNASNGIAKEIYTEKNNSWIDVNKDWTFLNDNKEFTITSDKDGWRHLYRIAVDGKKQTLVTKGDYDLIDLKLIDEKNNYAYFLGSPTNATQKYLYKTKLDGKGKLEMVTPSILPGTHDYDISPTGAFALHKYNSAVVSPISEWMNFVSGNPITMDGSVTNQMAKQPIVKNKVEFFKVTTEDGVVMDGWMKKPDNFNPNKKYPVLFYVYGEPASQTAGDVFSAGKNRLYPNLAKDGYIYISMDNRGAPVPKGATWRKSIYKNIGILNIRDQAMATKKLLATYPFMDKNRVAVWGWSGGGSSTLNLLFQYPEIYKTGIAIAAVGNQLTYDNIYQERYMGTPFPTTEAYVKGSPITYAKNLQGNLLYIHGTGDDNVHYQNAEMLINELVKNKKVFQLMSYPNRSHSISEGEGTSEHLALTFTKFLRENCPPGEK